MPDYGSILRFLAENPPQLPGERRVHASLLELLAHSLRTECTAQVDLRCSIPDGQAPHLLATHLAKAMAHH